MCLGRACALRAADWEGFTREGFDHLTIGSYDDVFKRFGNTSLKYRIC